jgi:bacteriocin-like protein
MKTKKDRKIIELDKKKKLSIDELKNVAGGNSAHSYVSSSMGMDDKRKR